MKLISFLTGAELNVNEDEGQKLIASGSYHLAEAEKPKRTRKAPAKKAQAQPKE